MNNNFYNNIKKIDNLIVSSTNLNQIENLFENKGIRKYFFNKIISNEDITTWLRPLHEAGFFDAGNHPKNEDYAPYTPYWDVLEFIKKVSDLNETNFDLTITKRIISIINPIIESSDILNNFRTDYYMTQIISTLPIEKIDDKYFEFLTKALSRDTDLTASAISEHFIPKLLKNKSEVNLLKLLKVILSFKLKTQDMINSNIDYSFSVLGDYQLTEVINKYKDEIIGLCEIKLINVIIEKMKELLLINPAAFNYIWIPTIESHPQTSFRDRYECQIVFLLRDSLLETNSFDLIKLINSLLDEEHYIFHRVAVHTINYRYEDLSSIFWSREWNPINNIFLKHEVFELLHSHSDKFSSEQIEKIITRIETADYFDNDRELSEEKKTKYTAYSKKEWYSSLLPSKNDKVITKYHEYNEINPAQLDHPGFNSWIGEFEGESSPLTSEQINKMTIEELLSYLNDYKGEEGWPSSNLSFHGFGNALRKAVSDEPMKYLDHIFDFFNIQNNYHYNIISGFKDALEKDKKAIIEFSQLFNYILKLTHKNEFKNYSADQKVYSIEADILRVSGWLIEDILRGDDILFSDEELLLIEEVLFYFETIAEPRVIEDIFNDSTDLISLVLNSPKGIIYNDLVLYSLKIIRNKQSEDKVKWKESVKDLFTARIKEGSKQEIELYIVLGEYLIQLFYLDSKWVKINLDTIFPEDEYLWKASFTGYLYRTNKVYKEIFDLLKQSDNYSRAIKSNLKGGYIDEQLIRHILVSYLNGWEAITDPSSLISQLFGMEGIDYYRNIAHFIWVSRDFFTDSEKQNRIKNLWAKIISNHKDILAKREIEIRNTEVFSDFLDWLVIFKTIDDELIDFITYSIINTKQNFRTRFLLEHLKKFIDAQPDVIGKIFTILIETGNIPTYQDDEVKILVEKLYELNQKYYADLICNKYGEEGFYFLRDTYFENNR